MIAPHARPKPVTTGRYRYTRLRWRIAVRVFDLVGSALMFLWRLIKPAKRIDSPQRILIIQLDHMGDAILSSTIFPRLRLAYPRSHITVLASPSNREIFEANPDVDEVQVANRNWFERKPGRKALLSAVWTLGRSLRSHQFDLGIDVRGDILSVIVLTIAGIPRRLGWTMGGGGFLLTDVGQWVPGRHEVASREALLDVLGIPSNSYPVVRVHARDSERSQVAVMLKEAWPAPATPQPALVYSSLLVHSASSSPEDSWIQSVESWGEPDELHADRFSSTPLLAVHLGAGAASKRWPTRHWQSLINYFLDDGWRVILVGGPEDRATASAIEPHPSLRDWTGRLAVTETATLLERADLFIGSDSGPAHIAASAAVTSVILFSGTNRPGQWRPWSRRALVLRQKVSCRPCHHKSCPLADHPCMTGLDPLRVYKSAHRWWTRLHGQELPHAPL